MFKKICLLIDYLWVLQAFLRGKLLRQKAYQSQNKIFRLPCSVTARRILILAKWWNLRPMTAQEMWYAFHLASSEEKTFSSETVIKTEKGEECVCSLCWGDGRWEVNVRPRDDRAGNRSWNDRSHFLAV